MSRSSLVWTSGIALVSLLGPACAADDGDAEGVGGSETGDGAGLIEGRCTLEAFWDDDGLWSFLGLLEDEPVSCDWRCPPNYAFQSLSPIEAETWSPWAPTLSEADSVRIVLVGDGGVLTPGAGGISGAEAVAIAAHDACEAAGGCHLALQLGDAFYSHEVDSADHADWAKWRSAYSRFCEGGTCTADNTFRFWGALGNHDYFPPSKSGDEDLVGNDIQALVDYTEHPDNAGHLWMLPDRRLKIPGLPAWLDIWIVDSVAVVEALKWDFEGEGGAIADQQLDWLIDEMAGEPAEDWKLVAAHHPALTVGRRLNAYEQDLPGGTEHRRCQSYVEIDGMRRLADALAPVGLHALISGHEHNHQLNAGQGYLQVVTGNGSKISSSDFGDSPDVDTALFRSEGELGFAILEATPETIELGFYATDDQGQTWSMESDEPFVYTRDDIAALQQALGPLLSP